MSSKRRKGRKRKGFPSSGPGIPAGTKANTPESEGPGEPNIEPRPRFPDEERSDSEVRRVPDARLLAAFGWLEVEDIDALWQQLSPESQRRICHLLGISLDPAFVSGGIGKLLKSSMRRLPPGIDAFVAELMAEPLVRDHVELHDSLPTTGEEYIAAVDSLLESWPVGAVRLGACLWAIEEDQAVHLVESHDRVGVHLSVAEEAVRALGAGERLPTPTLEPFDSSESRPAGQGAKNDDVAADSAHQSTPEDEAALFSTLDQILVKNAIATHLDYTGSLTPGDLRRLVLEVTRLSLDRRQSYYFHGLVRSLDPEMPPPKKAAMNDDRWAWYRFGRISGLVRQGAAEDLADQVVKWPDETKDVLGDPRRGASIAAPCVLAVLGRDDRLAAELLDVAGPDFASRTACMHAVYEHARMILAADQPTEAFLLFDSLLGLKQPRRPFPTGVPESWIDLHRRLSACMRARGDFSVAEALIDDVADLSEDDPLDNESRAVLEAERGLICAQLDHLGHLTFPKDPDQRNQVRERVQRGAANLNEALELFVDEVRANYCMGVLAVCEENWQRAEQLLERADRGVRSDPVFDSTGIARAIRFYRGVAILLALEVGDDGPAYAHIKGAVEDGYAPTDYELQYVIAGLEAHGSAHLSDFLLRVVDRAGPAVLAKSILDALPRGDRSTIDAAIELARNPATGCSAAFDLLEGALTACGVCGDYERASNAVNELGLLVPKACDGDLETRWERLLADDELLRETMGPPDADAERVEALRRTGDIEGARGIVVQMFHRAVVDDLPGFDAGELLEQLEHDLKAPQDQVAGLAEHLTDEAQRSEVDGSAVRVIFVGGNETQERYEQSLETSLAEDFGGRVTVTWNFSGWSSNWSRLSSRVALQMDTHDVVVLMTLVRTNLGRRIRQLSSEKDVPWVSCTGHGRHSMELAIHRAVEVADRRNRV